MKPANHDLMLSLRLLEDLQGEPWASAAIRDLFVFHGRNRFHPRIEDLSAMIWTAAALVRTLPAQSRSCTPAGTCAGIRTAAIASSPTTCSRAPNTDRAIPARNGRVPSHGRLRKILATCRYPEGLKSDYPRVVPYKRLTKERFLTRNRKVQTYQEEAHSRSGELGWVRRRASSCQQRRIAGRSVKHDGRAEAVLIAYHGLGSLQRVAA
jgi:hypothetical protein